MAALEDLAACYMDSMTSLSIPASGYEIRYDHGLFAQSIREGWQDERLKQWLRLVGNCRATGTTYLGGASGIRRYGHRFHAQHSAHRRGTSANILRLWGAPRC
jgi:glucan phosphorylase